MACSKYKSTRETTHAARLSRLLVDPCTDLCRDLLRNHSTEINFPGILRQKKQVLSPILNKAQRGLLYPIKGSYTGTYNDFDLSLLYVLLRNIAGIVPHKKGWASPPDPSDRSLSANIDRIREIRNTYCGHAARVSLSDSEFKMLWQDLTVTIGELEGSLPGGCTTYTDAANQIEVDTMDPEQEKRYLDVIDTQHQDIEVLKETTIELQEQVADVQEQVSGVQEQVSDVQEQVSDVQGQVSDVQEQVAGLQMTVEKQKISDAKSPIPPNVREQYDIDIRKWRGEDKRYYETHSFSSMMQKVRNQPYVTFVGVPGSGKTASVHHIALKLQEEGYEVVPVDEIREIKQYCDTKKSQVFLIDDIVGVFGLQKTKLDMLREFEHKITQPCMVKSRTLMTCREAVFNEALLCKTFLTKEDTVIKLHSSEHALDNKDKKEILQKYDLNINLISPALLTSTSRMFPLLCKLFSKETKFQALGSKFFLNPVQCIIDELDEMQRENKLNYATLVLCVLNRNCLSEKILDETENEHFMNMKKDTLKKCRLEYNTDTFKFMDVLSAMEGTYIKQCGVQFTVIHDSMFEICAYHYGQKFHDQILIYTSSSYIANYVKPQKSDSGILSKVKEKQGHSQYVEGDESSCESSEKEKENDDKNNERAESFDLCIRLREDQYPLLAKRLYRDIQNMELYDVFRNQVLKHHKVCQTFVDVLEMKSWTEVKFLFLSSHEHTYKIVNKQKYVVKESESRKEWGEWWKQNILVDRRYKRDDKGKLIYNAQKYNIRVISWVIYYRHPRILQYLIQRTGEHNEINELFGITGNTPNRSKSISHMCNNRGQKETKSLQEREVFREQFRLLLLSCYSGDVQTVKIILPYVYRKSINWIDQIGEGVYGH
ncbi:uncharacterized protein LOC125666252 [Ostrea edulis]|uniref:uncharacterized protein LOC125666252 n=1 Tax=Ostrea edulis TaxID=37623 RepID=UPI0024AF1080|nr:uncharacterized protein LOC125666252 [Ostrea edulis]